MCETDARPIWKKRPERESLTYLARRNIGDIAFVAAIRERRNGFQDGGRDGDCSPPPAQTRTGPIKASGSYLEYLTAKRALGQG
jgi:hypothetical protein